MDLYSDIANEIVAETLASEHEESRAIMASFPTESLPGSHSIEQAAKASAKPSKRQAKAAVSSREKMPASTLSGQAGAAETVRLTQPIPHVSRRQNSSPPPTHAAGTTSPLGAGDDTSPASGRGDDGAHGTRTHQGSASPVVANNPASAGDSSSAQGKCEPLFLASPAAVDNPAQAGGSGARRATDTLALGSPAPSTSASADGDDRAHEPYATPADALPVVAEIVALWRMRSRWWKAELKLILQAQAICRMWTDGDKAKAASLYGKVKKGEVDDPTIIVALGPFLAAMEPFAAEGAAYEKRIAKLARSLPVYPWVKGVWGFSDLALGKIVGEAGDIGSYRNPSCLWKRLGLAVIDGGRQRKVGDADEALIHGYSPGRRSTMWNIGNGLIGGMGKGVRPLVGEDWQAREDWSPYQKLYVGRLVLDAEADPEAHARPVTAAGKMSFSKHAHNRAKRYVEKRALRDLWSAWRAAEAS